MVATVPLPRIIQDDLAPVAWQENWTWTRYGPKGPLSTSTLTYEIALGVRISRDPIAEKGGINLYDYVSNDPINGSDPLGLKTCWKRVRLTTFNDQQGAYKNGDLGPNDLGVGNYGAGANSPIDGQLAPGQTNQPAYPPGSTIGVYPDSGPSFQGRVSDWGSYNIKHPGTPTNGWIDVHHPDHSDFGWISFTVSDCNCPAGSVDPSKPFSNN